MNSNVQGAEIPTEIERFTLIGYAKIADHGFALPCFGQKAGANLLSVAVGFDKEETQVFISRFEPFIPEDGCIIYNLPVEVQREVGIGEPWIDIFIWKDQPYVGSRKEIWDSLGPWRAQIAKSAPLSLLALANGAARPEASDLVDKI